MNVTLNQNSWHFKIYSKVVGNTPPKTLCPYFWSLVAIITLSPLLLFVHIVGLVTKFFDNIEKNRRIKKEMKDTRTNEEIMEAYRKKWDEEDRKEKESVERWNKITEVVTIFFKWVVLPLGCVSVIYFIYSTGNKIGWYQLLALVAVSIGFIAFIFFWVWLIEKYGNKIFGPIGRGLGKLNPFKWGVTQIIGGMIYSVYKKACPIITWEGKPVNNDRYGIN